MTSKPTLDNIAIAYRKLWIWEKCSVGALGPNPPARLSQTENAKEEFHDSHQSDWALIGELWLYFWIQTEMQYGSTEICKRCWERPWRAEEQWLKLTQPYLAPQPPSPARARPTCPGGVQDTQAQRVRWDREVCPQCTQDSCCSIMGYRQQQGGVQQRAPHPWRSCTRGTQTSQRVSKHTAWKSCRPWSCSVAVCRLIMENCLQVSWRSLVFCSV